MKNFGIKSDKELDSIIGEVKLVTNKKFEIIDGVKKLSDHSIIEYYSHGYRKNSIYFDKKGAIRIRQVYRFDNSGDKIGYTNYNAAGIIESQGKYELDFEGRIVRRFHNGELEETFKYDEYDNIIEVYYPITGGWDFYDYDENGLVKQQSSLRGENSLPSPFLVGPKKKLITYLNDKWGNIKEAKVFNAETKELLVSQKNSINKQGDEIESIDYQGNGLVRNHIKYEYKYDNIGNWILKKTKTKDGHIYREHERVITYYNEIN
jgi:hypothetical protein